MSEAISTEQSVKKFEMKHKVFPNSIEKFSEHTAPNWLTGRGIRLGSTIDVRGFWNNHVMTLGIGESVETELRIITRIQ